jgi:hypothetical protein
VPSQPSSHLPCEQTKKHLSLQFAKERKEQNKSVLPVCMISWQNIQTCMDNFGSITNVHMLSMGLPCIMFHFVSPDYWQPVHKEKTHQIISKKVIIIF